MRLKTFILFLTVALVSGFAGFGYHFYSTFSSQPAGDSEEEVVFEVTPGQSFMSVANQLERDGLVRNARLFYIFARLKGRSGALKQGEYAAYSKMNPAEVLSVITSGKSIGRKFTIVEGANIFELADLFEKGGFGKSTEFMKWVKDQAFIQELLGYPAISLEGYLYPETYSITKFMNTQQILRLMVQTFQEHFREVEADIMEQKLTKHQVVTLASIIEKETGVEEERTLISSIFHNRLKKNMLLQTDPTILYGMADLSGQMIMSITRNDIRKATRYNTYVIRGLPPGPIANPGIEAIRAALAPAETNFLYFVSQNNGTHIFSENYEGHKNAVQKHQIDPKARKGKSWRDLKKNSKKDTNKKK